MPLLHSTLGIPAGLSPEYLAFFRLLPLALEQGELVVAVAGEENPEVLEDLRHHYGVPLRLQPVAEDELLDAIRRTAAQAESMVELVRDLGSAGSSEGDASGEPLADARDLANQPPVIRFVNLLIREAHSAAASDIHLEATADGLRVRLRIDGVLTELPSPPPALQAAVVSRIKLLAELDIAQRRLPQDGRIRVRLEARELDLRVSTVPTLHGESVVLRLLDRGGRLVGLDELGMPPALLERFRALAGRSHGIVLSTGPTGSGKTTTLYAALALRRSGEEKIITVEDPVEYHLPGVTQVPVHVQSGMTFAAALRSILRQDPDVLMVGEMRDAETAAIAVQAAMTGHLVFSTLHTNDAVSALTRLTDLGVEPYMIAASLEGVLAQRLVRKTCAECRERYRPDPGALALLREGPVVVPDIEEGRLERGRGCDGCRQTGYRGRTGIYELLTMSEELQQMLITHPSPTDLRRLAAAEGMTTLKQDGWSKVQAGMTTVEEVMRVVGQ